MSNGNYTIVNNMERFTAWQIPNKKEAANLYDLHIPDWMAATIEITGLLRLIPNLVSDVICRETIFVKLLMMVLLVFHKRSSTLFSISLRSKI